MTFLGRTAIFLSMSLSAVAASAVVPNFTCRPDNSKATVAAPNLAAHGPCDAKTPDTAAKSADVVSASELTAEYADLKLSQREVQNLVLSARTRSEHLRLASYYGVRAEQDQAKAMHQLRIALDYRANTSSFAAGSVHQCVDTARRLRQHASEMRKLQKEQEQLARNAGE